MIEGLPTYYDEDGVIQYDMVAIWNERQGHLYEIYLLREALRLIKINHGASDWETVAREAARIADEALCET